MATQHQPTRRTRPATAADLWRLADQGRANGVTILSECASGERFATSATAPATVYRLSERGCTCQGFTYAGRCQHHALLLAELGWLPDVAGDDPAPEPPTPAAPAALPPGRVVCPGCGRGGIIINNRPIPAGWRCPRCRPAVAPVRTPGNPDDLAALLAEIPEEEDDAGDGWNDDLAASCPDDSSRFAAVAHRYHIGAAA